MKISQATAVEKALPVPFGDATLNVSYRPLTYTVTELEKMETGDAKAAQIIDSMLRLLVSWDLTDEFDQPVPLTADALREIPTHIFTGIMQAVGKDQTPSGEA